MRRYLHLPIIFASTIIAVFGTHMASADEKWPRAKEFSEGTKYIFALDEEQDFQRGLELISDAAEAGNPEAQYALAMIYRLGGHVRKDPVKSRKLLESAAGAGLAEAQTVLGQDIHDSLGDYDSPKHARALLKAAADQGNLIAHNRLGQSYMFKTLQNYDKALKHLTVAAQGGIVEAQLMLGIAYYNGGGLYRSFKPADHKQGFAWIRKAAEEGNHPLAWTWMGWIHQEGHAVEKDLNKAAEYFRMAAELGDSAGAKALANAYRDGLGVPQGTREYRAWLQRAAELGSPGAKEAVERERLLAEKRQGQVLAVLFLLGLAAGGASDTSSDGVVRIGGPFMDASDPMQLWGLDIMMRIN